LFHLTRTGDAVRVRTKFVEKSRLDLHSAYNCVYKVQIDCVVPRGSGGDVVSECAVGCAYKRIWLRAHFMCHAIVMLGAAPERQVSGRRQAPKGQEKDFTF